MDIRDMEHVKHTYVDPCHHGNRAQPKNNVSVGSLFKKSDNSNDSGQDDCVPLWFLDFAKCQQQIGTTLYCVPTSPFT